MDPNDSKVLSIFMGNDLYAREQAPYGEARTRLLRAYDCLARQADALCLKARCYTALTVYLIDCHADAAWRQSFAHCDAILRRMQRFGVC
jgi:hypothetical protein